MTIPTTDRRLAPHDGSADVGSLLWDAIRVSRSLQVSNEPAGPAEGST